MITSADIRDHSAMALQQKKIYRRNVLLNRAPHIGTNTVIKIGRCVNEYNYQDPFYVPPYDDLQEETRRDVVEWAVYVKWEFAPNACENMIRCNPYFPKSAKCKNLPSTDTAIPADGGGGGGGIDEPFSFRDATTGQRFDACQPVCYDPAAAQDNYVGLFTISGADACYVADPLLLAFYLDPSRRVTDETKEIVEDSAFYVTKRNIGLPPRPALVASLPPGYCRQYGLDFVVDNGGRDRTGGEPMHACSQDESILSLDTIAGSVLSRAAHIGLYKAVKRVSTEPIGVEQRLPPTSDHLKDEHAWKSNVVAGKRALPFPLKSSDLGIVVGTKTEWLLWTDEYSHLDDGRNDVYGGRLVERDTAVPFDARLGASLRRVSREGRYATRRARRTTGELGTREDVETVPSDPATRGATGTRRREVDILKAVEASVSQYRLMVQQHGYDTLLHEHDTLKTMTDQIAGQSVLDLYAQRADSVARALKSTLRSGSKIHADALGYSLANASMTTALERGVVAKTADFMKKVLRLPKTVAGVFQLVGFIGFAVDLFSEIVYDPLHRYKNHFSDRALRALAEAELLWNARYLGTNRVAVTPYDWLVNTPYYDVDEELKVSLLVLPAILQARSVNSDGGLIKRSAYSYIEMDVEGRLSYAKDGRRVSLDDPTAVIGAIGQTVEDAPDSAGVRNDRTRRPVGLALANAAFYYIVVLFVVTTVLSVVSGFRRVMFPIAVLATVVSVALPISIAS